MPGLWLLYAGLPFQAAPYGPAYRFGNLGADLLRPGGMAGPRVLNGGGRAASGFRSRLSSSPDGLSLNLRSAYLTSSLHSRENWRVQSTILNPQDGRVREC